MILSFAHKTTALLLAIILLTNNINTVIIIGDFIINQDFIAKTLCVQKEEQKGCNGKCHLKKELSQNSSDSNSEIPLPETKRMMLDLYCITHISVVKQQWFDQSTSTNKIISNNAILQSVFYDIDTPPPIFS